MKTFTVYVLQRTNFAFTVEAKNKEEAEEEGLRLYHEGFEPDWEGDTDYFVDSDEIKE